MGQGGGDVLGYTVELRSHYRIAVEAAPVDALAWAPDGTRLAYRVAGTAGSEGRLRVRGLLGSGNAVTVAIGAVDPPRWQADGRHLIFISDRDGGSDLYLTTVPDAAPARP